MIATTSIGPGALNMVTAAGVAHANRLPVLLISGDTFTNRLPDPVLQQVEHFGDPDHHGQRRVQGGDALLGPHHPSRADLSSLPQAVAAMLDPADCGPAFLGAAAGHPGDRVRLSAGLLRGAAVDHSAAAPGPAEARARPRRC